MTPFDGLYLLAVAVAWAAFASAYRQARRIRRGR